MKILLEFLPVRIKDVKYFYYFLFKMYDGYEFKYGKCTSQSWVNSIGYAFVVYADERKVIGKFKF